MAPFGRVVTLPPFYPDATPKHLFFIDVVDRHMAVDETRVSIGVSAVEPGLVTKIFFVRASENSNVEAVDALDAREDASWDFIPWNSGSCGGHEENGGWTNPGSNESLRLRGGRLSARRRGYRRKAFTMRSPIWFVFSCVPYTD